jgi:hypothetical protein
MTESQMRAEVKHLHQCVEELKKSVAENAVEAVLEQGARHPRVISSSLGRNR